jgi:DNA-binding IclR family transcriptional regulator
VLAFAPRSAPQVAAALQVHPRTARRLLNRLVYDGWLRRTEGARPMYAPTMRVVALAAQLTERSALVRHGATVAWQLHATTGLGVHLAVPSYRQALRLLRVVDGDGPRAQRDLAPAHAIAGGKLLLAFREPWCESVLERPLEAVTDSTIVDADAMRGDAASTRARGYAVEDGEYLPGVRAIAAPVRDGSGDVVSALAVSGVTDEGAAVDAVATAAESLSGMLQEGP